MGTLYADRGFVSVNGVPMVDVESITMNISDGTKFVPTMTRDRRYKGTVKGNRDIKLSVAVAVQNALGSPKLEQLDYQNNDVAITFEHGVDRYTLIGVDLVDSDQSASGVGSEGKKSFNLIARDVIVQVIDTPLFPTSLSFT